MNEGLRQSVENAAGSARNAWIASGVGVSAGLSTWFELIGPVLGSMASFVASVLGLVLLYGQIKKGRAERRILYLQAEELERKKAARCSNCGGSCDTD